MEREKKIHLARERQRVERWRMRSWYSSLFEELDDLLTDLFAASMMTVEGLRQKKNKINKNKTKKQSGCEPVLEVCHMTCRYEK